MQPTRIIDLTHPMIPGEEEFTLEIETFNAEEAMAKTRRESTHQIQRGDDVWYILQDVKMSSHVGTHIEFPYHHMRDGKTALEYPLTRLMGDTVLLDFSRKGKDEEITLDEILSCGIEIRRGDIVFIRTDMHKLWKTPKGHDRPVLAIEAAEHLAKEIGIACIGTDATGLEVRGRDDQPVHVTLFSHDVAKVESLTNLDKLNETRFTTFILPLPIKGLDACPVRVLAFEGCSLALPETIVS